MILNMVSSKSRRQHMYLDKMYIGIFRLLRTVVFKGLRESEHREAAWRHSSIVR